jgi:bifunctional DNA-binding transcriptional regulator/antitoxin component of YhaV-PrlF toxin-antitoxin module
MTLSMMSSMSSTGRLTVPHKLRAHLGLRGGSKVVLQEVTPGRRPAKCDTSVAAPDG